MNVIKYVADVLSTSRNLIVAVVNGDSSDRIDQIIDDFDARHGK